MAAGIPEAFVQVSLGDQWTWHRATMREWLDQRRVLWEKRRTLCERWDIQKINADAMIYAHNTLGREMGIYDGSPHPPPGDDIAKRGAELKAEYIRREYAGYEPLTEWEQQFLDASEWLDSLMEDYRRAGNRSASGTILSWLVAVESEQDLANKRAQQRVRNRDAVNQCASRRLKSKKNPFFPRPLELVQIAMAAEIVVANAARELSVFCSYGDPVPGTESVHEFRVREFMRSASWKRRPGAFVDNLRRLGYETVHNEFECHEWPGWHTFLLEAQTKFEAGELIEPRPTSRALLAWLFDVDVLTIRKYVSRGMLTRAYAKAGLNLEYRIFVEKKQTIDCANVYRSGWASRVSSGRPESVDTGMTFYLMPYYS